MAYLLDTSALLAHFRRETGADQVQAIFDREDEDILLASVSLPEFARRLRDLGSTPQEARSVVGQHVQSVTTVVPMDAEVATASFDLICQLPERLPLMDALIAAAARSRQASLVHRDTHMRSIPAALLTPLDLDEPP